MGAIRIDVANTVSELNEAVEGGINREALQKMVDELNAKAGGPNLLNNTMEYLHNNELSDEAEKILDVNENNELVFNDALPDQPIQEQEREEESGSCGASEKVTTADESDQLDIPDIWDEEDNRCPGASIFLPSEKWLEENYHQKP